VNETALNHIMTLTSIDPRHEFRILLSHVGKALLQLQYTHINTDTHKRVSYHNFHDGSRMVHTAAGLPLAAPGPQWPVPLEGPHESGPRECC
jgi:hypothetical protein